MSDKTAKKSKSHISPPKPKRKMRKLTEKEINLTSVLVATIILIPLIVLLISVLLSDNSNPTYGITFLMYTSDFQEWMAAYDQMKLINQTEGIPTKAEFPKIGYKNQGLGKGGQFYYDYCEIALGAGPENGACPTIAGFQCAGENSTYGNKVEQLVMLNKMLVEGGPQDDCIPWGV